MGIRSSVKLLPLNKIAPRALRLSRRQATEILRRRKTETARYANVKTKNYIDPRAKSAGNCQLNSPDITNPLLTNRMYVFTIGIYKEEIK